MNRPFNMLSLITLTISSLVMAVHGQQYSDNLYVNPTYQMPQYGVSTCNDLQCKVDECCVETYRSPQCVALITAAGQAYCPRLKKCYSNTQCPATFCCVQYLDTTYAKTCPRFNAYGSGYGNSYPSGDGFNNGFVNNYGSTYGGPYTNTYGGPYTNTYGNDISTDSLNFREGYCVPPASSGVCYKAVPGAAVTGSCPCSGTNAVCQMVLDPFPIGKCV